MTLSPAQTADFLGFLGPTVARSGLATRVECCATEGWDYAQQPALTVRDGAFSGTLPARSLVTFQIRPQR